MHTNEQVETVNSITEHFPCVSNALSIPHDISSTKDLLDLLLEQTMS